MRKELRHSSIRTAVVFSALTVITTGMIVFGDSGPPASAAAPIPLDPPPPKEFVSDGGARRMPAAVDLKQVMSARTYEYLDESERRALFRAVIFFCNEGSEAAACAQYLKYCAGACDLLVKR